MNSSAVGIDKSHPLFNDRFEAGRALARLLKQSRTHGQVMVLALPRGGVPVGFEIAKALGVDLDVLVVRKFGLPSNPERAIGAIASGGAFCVNADVRRKVQISDKQLYSVLQHEQVELHRREAVYRGHRPPFKVAGRTVVVVDDGMSTGSSLVAALTTLRRFNAARIVVAVPVAPARAIAQLDDRADDFVCVRSPCDFSSVGQYYRHFESVSDAEVRHLLAGHEEARSA